MDVGKRKFDSGKRDADRDREALQRMKAMEAKLLKKGKLTRVDTPNGYAMTTRPDEYKRLQENIVINR